MEVRNLERNREIFKNDEYESKPQRLEPIKSARLFKFALNESEEEL